MSMCKTCNDPEQIKCKGEPYKTRMKLDCKFHAREKPRACGSSSHQRSSHKDCPFNKTSDKKDGQSETSTLVLGHVSESGEEISYDDLSDLGGFSSASEESVVVVCTCGAERRAHKRTCPLSCRSGHTLSPPPSSSGAAALPSALEPDGAPSVNPEEVKPQVKVGDYVCVHNRNVGSFQPTDYGIYFVALTSRL